MIEKICHALHPRWSEVLRNELELPYFAKLMEFLDSEMNLEKEIYPPLDQVFRAFEDIEPQNVKVVIMGQDPYYKKHQAQGLCFSVDDEIKTPPSLVNILKELKSDLGIERTSSNLESWSKQGVLLLNSILTVEKDKPGSHQKKGWERFTDMVLTTVNKQSPHCVFILWGSYAQKKGQFVDDEKHLKILSPHPSPLSVYRGFWDSKPFSKTNTFLKEKGLKAIEW
jgi:uracil-DNA glycosylase